MRIALVQCPPWGSLPPLGLASLKPWVEAHGHEAPCFDLNIDYCRERLREALDDVGGSVYARPDPWVSGSFDEWAWEFDGEVRFTSTLKERPLPIARWADRVLSCDPQAVGFSLQSTNLGVTLQLAQEIARRDPSLTVVFGGPNVAEAQDGAVALRTGIPDVVVEGEGEETLVELLDALEAGRDLAGVAGIGRLVGGVPTWTPRRPLLKDVDALPFPDFTDFDWLDYPNPYEIPIMTSRGCVLNCAFCYETVYWKRFRTQSPERIVAEMQHQIDVHPLRDEAAAGRGRFGMSFADSLVNGHLGGLRRMAEMLIESQTDIYWNGQATINTKMDDAFFRVLSDSGCSGLSFGLESGSSSVLESMGKRFDIHEATEFFERVQRVGIELVVNVMVGFPTETRADFLQTLRFLAKIRRSIYMANNVSPTAVVGGSKLASAPAEFGITPVNITGWEAREDFRWTSEAAGDERNRNRRLRILHLWMTALRIPHQRIGPPRVRLPKLPRPWARSAPAAVERGVLPEQPHAGAVSPWKARARVRRIAGAAGEDPLVIVATAGRIELPEALPGWARQLHADRWAGEDMERLQALVSEELGQPLRITRNASLDGMQDVTVEVVEPELAAMRGFRVLVFPNLKGPADQLLALIPLAAHAVAAGDRA